MNSIAELKNRMTDLAAVLQADDQALALLGLGSIGREEERLDEYSDLDFFVIVRPGSKRSFIDDPSWLSRVKPVSYLFRNTPDGFKLMWDDGIFGEMAVFEAAELASIPFAPGKAWWVREGFDPAQLEPQNRGGRLSPPASADFCVNELLTCLYVGLCRYRRGEKLSAWRFIQSHCLDRALELAGFWEKEEPGFADLYSRDRRFEQRYPSMAPLLGQVLLGYEHIPRSALTLLEWVEGRTEVNRALAGQIRELAGV